MIKYKAKLLSLLLTEAKLENMMLGLSQRELLNHRVRIYLLRKSTGSLPGEESSNEKTCQSFSQTSQLDKIFHLSRNRVNKGENSNSKLKQSSSLHFEEISEVSSLSLGNAHLFTHLPQQLIFYHFEILAIPKDGMAQTEMVFPGA